MTSVNDPPPTYTETSPPAMPGWTEGTGAAGPSTQAGVGAPPAYEAPFSAYPAPSDTRSSQAAAAAGAPPLFEAATQTPHTPTSSAFVAPTNHPLLFRLAERFRIPILYKRTVHLTVLALNNLPLKRNGKQFFPVVEIFRVEPGGTRSLFKSGVLVKARSLAVNITVNFSLDAAPAASDPTGQATCLEIHVRGHRDILMDSTLSILKLSYAELVQNPAARVDLAYGPLQFPLPKPPAMSAAESRPQAEQSAITLKWMVATPAAQDIRFEGEFVGFYAAGNKMLSGMQPSNGNFIIRVNNLPVFVFHGDNSADCSNIVMSTAARDGIPSSPLLRLVRTTPVTRDASWTIQDMSSVPIARVSLLYSRIDYMGGGAVQEVTTDGPVANIYEALLSWPNAIVYRRLLRYLPPPPPPPQPAEGQAAPQVFYPPPTNAGTVTYPVESKFSATFAWNEDCVQLLAQTVALCVARNSVRSMERTIVGSSIAPLM
ncbi:hypothetical protein CAOG_00041 [Capsaspora owczarzaki ATCC 30864]|uniref:Uncharacterized protein n=1 Tax=Capsaspora owczarzaki (strain ATCC 30864) TaxID=595528 RepID=A0A0D2X037_CAPO3|nr:hypothetical protein CAOG_00041 [Capsaspora owczarzaki ATCC 30864]KJE88379.1 hypothetical protein CAOG_000041 [Capsaspora owczarzaki ATCC 30864]|eukprot:XP_004364912.2 hypothetical protein CAOG_00041 [Capsaspora owczarzaki ATCC 30864]